MALRHYFFSTTIYYRVHETFFLVPPPHCVSSVIYENKVLYIRIVNLCIRIYLYYFYLLYCII